MLWKIKFWFAIFFKLCKLLKNYDQRLWMRYREDGTGARNRLQLRPLDLKRRRESAGSAYMTKVDANQWELISAYTNTDPDELSEALEMCALNLITWAVLLDMKDPIETAEDRKGAEKTDNEESTEE